jgi:nitroreductase
MDLEDVIRTTAAVRDFQPDALADPMLHGILDLARFAGSGGFTTIESFAGEGIEVNRVVPRADCCGVWGD